MKSSPIRILLIEDNPGDAKLLELMLQDAPGFAYEIDWVENLAAGIAKLCSEQVDVVLLDLGMPGSFGLQTLQRLLSQVSQVPALIVLSSLFDEEVAMQAVQSGAQDYLIKGNVDSVLLTRSIRYAIERSQAQEALRRAHAELERRVTARTAELAQTVDALGRNVIALKETERRLKESQSLLRQLAARTEAVLEEERRHLRREIHDELGQYLSALRMGVSVIGLQFGEHNPALNEKTQHLVRLVDSTIKVVRDVVASLRPAALDMGIISALEWLVEEFIARTRISCTLQVQDEEMALDEKRATEIFRIVQESLTNISRHAEASEVVVTLERAGSHYVLSVCDNGQGFDPAVRKEKSFGLIGIRERALMLGGEADIFSAPEQGTLIKVHFPIQHILAEQ